MENPRKIPVHVLTGFLGSGKTTLLNEILKQAAFANSAVIINEFGEIGIDHHLVETGDDTIIELSNGCLCCTVRGQLVETIEELLKRNPERILIETTGLADPVPVLQALIASPAIADQLFFSGLLTTFDAVGGLETVRKQKEAQKQIALADTIIITKLDEVEQGEENADYLAALAELKTLNPSAEIVIKSDFLEALNTYLKPVNSAPVLPPIDDHFHHHHDVNRHSETINATLLAVDAAVERQQLEMFLDLLLSAHSEHVLRLKGLVYLVDESRPLVIQAVGNRLSEPYFLEHWPQATPATAIVVFLENLPADFVQRLFSGFFNKPEIDTPDRHALMDNPLSIAGYSSPSKK